MIFTIDSLIEKADRIELLVRMTSTLNTSASNIKKQVNIVKLIHFQEQIEQKIFCQAGQARRETYWRSIRAKVIIGAAGAAAIIGFFIIV